MIMNTVLRQHNDMRMPISIINMQIQLNTWLHDNCAHKPMRLLLIENMTGGSLCQEVTQSHVLTLLGGYAVDAHERDGNSELPFICQVLIDV